MTPTLPACLSLEKLLLSVKLGCGAEERTHPQPVELDLKIYFPRPAAFEDDTTHEYLCYDQVCLRIIAMLKDREFRLLEFLGGEIHRTVRSYLEETLPPGIAASAKLWLRISKRPPVPYVIGCAAFEYTDMP